MKRSSRRSNNKARLTYRIKIIYHGGTIGMKRSRLGGYVEPRSDIAFSRAMSKSVSFWQREGASNFTADYLFMTAADSIHVLDTDWTALILKIKEAQDEGYDGVLIAHGTDTMTYSVCATALGLLGGSDGLKIPVVFTGSQKPLGIFGGDADMNLQHSLMVLQEAIERPRPVADVMLVFGTKVIRGCRALKTSEAQFGAFHSPSEPGKVGYIDAMGVYLDESKLRLKKEAKGPLTVSPHFFSGVYVQVLSANTSPEPLMKMVEGGMIKALVLQSPGAGNAPIQGRNNFLPLIRYATKEAHVPVVVVSQYESGTTGHSSYPTGKKLLEAGAVACFDTTHVAADVKISWLLAQGITSPKRVKEAMAKSFAGEVSRPAMKLVIPELPLPRRAKLAVEKSSARTASRRGMKSAR